MTCYDLYTSPNNIRSTHGKKRSAFFNEGNLMERDNLEDLGRDGRIILQRVLKKLGGMALAALICFCLGTSWGGAFVHTALNLWAA